LVISFQETLAVNTSRVTENSTFKIMKNGLYPGIVPWWVYYFRPTIAAFAITGT